MVANPLNRHRQHRLLNILEQVGFRCNRVNRLKALLLLSECTGDDIWSLEYCRQRGIPEAWIEQLTDCYESGFQDDAQTIYFMGEITNQFEGIRDVDLAVNFAKFLGIDVSQYGPFASTRAELVQNIQDAAEEG